MSKQIKIRVYPDGRIESETVGIKGKQCLGYIKDIEAITGAKIYGDAFGVYRIHRKWLEK